MAAKCNAKRKKKDVKKRNKENTEFKRRAKKAKSKYRNYRSPVLESNKMEEVRRTWEVGKQLGLYAKNDEEILTTLVKGRI